MPSNAFDARRVENLYFGLEIRFLLHATGADGYSGQSTGPHSCPSSFPPCSHSDRFHPSHEVVGPSIVTAGDGSLMVIEL